MRTTLRFWRWRPNPLRRRSDRTEAWVVLVAGLLLCLGAPLAGTAAGLGMVKHSPGPTAAWHRATAVLVDDASSAPATGWSAVGVGNVRVAAEVQWTAADGTLRTGDAMVAPNSRAGQHVGIWLDRHGTLRSDPADPAQAQARAVVFGLMVATAVCLTALAAQGAAVALLNRRRVAALGREWAQVGPIWGRHPA
ncbi:hypothetical protein V2S66_23345 [Streptomyces sp. V4-01]|uniref:Integral membrane protein n=1 Tax=Actinacidiphila polyblastidii TaxID=3110430 RepID=A0ABU7PGQ4_9ACTN|nr:hypothetical protein [Streptomyces sp. V4-01]